MAKRSATSDLVRRSAGEIPPATPEHLGHLLAAMNQPIDTSEIPESTGPSHRLKRDADGRLPKRKESPLRSAILEGLRRRGMTRYQLWQEARAHCETLTTSAVYEYLRGQRDIGVPYVEAMMKAVGLVVRLPTMSRSTAPPKAVVKPSTTASAKPASRPKAAATAKRRPAKAKTR